eukprot:TRINITY_DN8089_c0_g3_i1.p1 TRINITY_DN8089_c0_g3~~TRINITY_DN8089_c0_g3_i1.p1  ORF type:complete len:143 (+),score=17.54 TRINITY_DN8089_c0_g3_i1:43-471(+)
MGCAASVRTTPQIQFSQVMPLDEPQFDEKTQVSSLKGKACIDGDCTRHALRIGSTSVESVPEPTNAVSLKSFYFEPSAENCSSEHPIQPCAPAHRRHLRRLDVALRCANAWPKDFVVDIEERRMRFDRKAKFQDLTESMPSS